MVAAGSITVAGARFAIITSARHLIHFRLCQFAYDRLRHGKQGDFQIPATILRYAVMER